MFRERKYKISCGIGKANYVLSAFDAALRDAGCANYNLLKLSSILPAGFSQVSKIDLLEGSVLPTAYCSFAAGENEKEYGQTIAAAIAVGIPRDRQKVGVIMEWAGCATLFAAESIVKDMVREAMKGRNVQDYDILLEGVESTVDEKITCVFAGISIW